MRNATWRRNKCGPEAGTSPPLGRDREWVGIRWGVSWMALRTPSYSEFCQCADRASVPPLPLVPAAWRSPAVECDWRGGHVPVGWCSSCPSLAAGSTVEGKARNTCPGNCWGGGSSWCQILWLCQPLFEGISSMASSAFHLSTISCNFFNIYILPSFLILISLPP